MSNSYRVSSYRAQKWRPVFAQYTRFPLTRLDKQRVQYKEQSRFRRYRSLYIYAGRAPESLLLRLPSVNNPHSAVWVMAPITQLASQLGAIHQDFLLRPAQDEACHIENEPFQVLIHSCMSKSANLLHLGVFGPSTNRSLQSLARLVLIVYRKSKRSHTLKSQVFMSTKPASSMPFF